MTVRLTTRTGDDLHARSKARATAEHRSVNSLVTELLENGVSKADAHSRRARLEAEGRVARQARAAAAMGLSVR